jgi:hydroxymethylbilane synthase
VNGHATLTLGTRGSDLALWQAKRIAARTRDELGVECRIEVIATQGDRIQDAVFHKMEGKGFFTKELQDALLDGRVDLVVHSLKDLPTDEPRGLRLAAIPERGPAGDVVLARPGTLAPDHADPLGLAAGSIVGTSSLRRAAQVLAWRHDVTVRPLRGNVPTRVRKLRDGQYDAIVLASAGIDRLGLDLRDLERIDLAPEVMLPAPGQGALAIETRAGDPAVEPLLELHDPAAARCVGAERRLLEMLGGGCHLPLGCLAADMDGSIRLQAVLGEIDDEMTRAVVARVAARAPGEEAAARACFEALKLAMPEVVGP